DGAEVSGIVFNLPDGFAENATYYVTVVPYNSAGEASDCTEISFTTETLPMPPGCTTITNPTDGASRNTIDAGITWTAVAGATGYRISIGTTPGGREIVDNETVTGTRFIPTLDFAENTAYYITVIPFNAAGEAAGCGYTRFVITPGEHIGRTKYGISPNGDGINDFWRIEGIGDYPDNTVSIYNRWGDMVFQLPRYDNVSKVFTGDANRLTRLGGGALPSGTYFFVIQYRDGQEQKKVEGFLVLKR
ncbi:gliding motility-associated C-terminal domain-containing protein, partial [Parapedobacter sp. 10938]|uniref:gliding motility-associated C-terminal domain-containing protein n=1 Tax=Parapedobacter flavus TaxID=3110225 RepID=UPI002DB93296